MNNRVTVYQIKDEYQELRERPYAELTGGSRRVNASNYEPVYRADLEATDIPFRVFSRYTRQLPKDFRGHEIEVGDVFVFSQNGATSAYYVDLGTLIALPGFSHKDVASDLEIQENLEPEFGRTDQEDEDSILAHLLTKKQEADKQNEERRKALAQNKVEAKAYEPGL